MNAISASGIVRVCKIPLLARALGSKAKHARDYRVSCILYKNWFFPIIVNIVNILNSLVYMMPYKLFINFT